MTRGLGRYRRPTKERGAVAVELALLAPLLILLVFSIIEIGFLLSRWIAIDNAARAGAREAAVFGIQASDGGGSYATSSCYGIGKRVRAAAIGLGVNPALVQVEVSGGGNPCGTVANNGGSKTQKPCTNSSNGNPDVTVTARLPQAISIPFGPSFNTAATATGVFRCEFT